LSIVTDSKLVEAGKAKKFLLPFQPPFVLNTDIEKKVIITEGALDILDAS
jgi:16S rRNA processing protein RimM